MKKVSFLMATFCVALCMGLFSCNNPYEPNDPSNSGIGNDNTNTPEEPKPTTGTENGHSWVDLGLSVKWATCNIGAWKPEGYGNYYAWGETSTKSEYTEDNYTYKESPNSALPLIRDAAFANWGGTWRMPTYYELCELATLCTWKWTNLNGVNGYEVKSKSNNNSIFLPAAGYYGSLGLSKLGEEAIYRSSELDSDYEYSPCIYFSEMGIKYKVGSKRYLGNSVRAVCP